jgi:hypothetical protein
VSNRQQFSPFPGERFGILRAQAPVVRHWSKSQALSSSWACQNAQFVATGQGPFVTLCLAAAGMSCAQRCPQAASARCFLTGAKTPEHIVTIGGSSTSERWWTRPTLIANESHRPSQVSSRWRGGTMPAKDTCSGGARTAYTASLQRQGPSSNGRLVRETCGSAAAWCLRYRNVQPGSLFPS